MGATSESGGAGVPGPKQSERRANLELRVLVNDMLERVRELHRNSQVWDPGERARAEADLESIMARVRRETVRIATEEHRGTTT